MDVLTQGVAGGINCRNRQGYSFENILLRYKKTVLVKHYKIIFQKKLIAKYYIA